MTEVLNLKDERILRQVEKAQASLGETLARFEEMPELQLEHSESICDNLDVLISSGLFLEDELAMFHDLLAMFAEIALKTARAQGVPILRLDGTLEINGKLITEDDIIE